MAQQSKMDDARKQKFLDHLAEFGIVGHAAQHASPLAEKRGARSTFYVERRKDPEFAAAWEQAILDAEDRVLREMHRRGVVGYDEPVFGSLGNGMGSGEIGKRKVFSDRMLELYTRIKCATARQYLNTSKVEVSGKVEHTGSLDIASLSPAKQKLLEELLKPDEDQNETE